MKLREARFKKNISQWALSAKSGVHQSRISLIENDLVTPNKREKLFISEALGVCILDIDWPEVNKSSVQIKNLIPMGAD